MILDDIFIELRCAFDASSFFKEDWVQLGENRTQQYIKGFNSFFKIYKNHYSKYDNVYILHGLADTDRDIIPDLMDDFPNFGGQLTDSDGDGYGDNPDAPSVDKCPTIFGFSAYGHHG